MPKVTRSEIDSFRSELGLNPLYESEELQELDNRVEDLRLQGYKVRDGDLSILEGVETRPVSRVQKILDETAEIDKQSQEKQSKREQFILTHPDKYKQLVSTEKSVLEEKPEIQEAVVDAFMRESESSPQRTPHATITTDLEYPDEPRAAVEVIDDYFMNPYKMLPYVSGIADAQEIAPIVKAAINLEKGIETEDDLYTLKQFIHESNRDSTFGAQVLDIVFQLPAFAIELASTWGVFTAGKKVATEGAERVLKRLLKDGAEEVIDKKLVKLSLKSGASIAGATAQTPIAGSTRIYAGTIRNMMPGIEMTEHESGETSILVNSPGGDVLPALTRAFGEQWIETVSERSGKLFTHLGEPIMKSAIVSSFLRANKGKKVSDFKELVGRFGWNGVVNEMMEERVADVGRGVLFGEWHIPTTQQLMVEAVAFTIPGVSIKAAEHIIDRGDESSRVKGVVDKINADESIPFNIEYDEESTGEIVRPESWYREKHYDPEQFTEVKEGEEGYDTETNERQFRSHRTGFNETTETGEWRAVLNSKAGRDTVAEEAVEIFFRKAETENPELAGQIRAYVRELRSSLEEAGYNVGFDDIELWSSAYTYNVLGYANENPESAWMYSVPQEMVNAFDAFMGSAKDGTAVADIIRGDSQLEAQAFSEEESEAIAGQAIDEGISERGPPAEGTSAQLKPVNISIEYTREPVQDETLRNEIVGKVNEIIAPTGKIELFNQLDLEHAVEPSIGSWGPLNNNFIYKFPESRLDEAFNASVIISDALKQKAQFAAHIREDGESPAFILRKTDKSKFGEDEIKEIHKILNPKPTDGEPNFIRMEEGNTLFFSAKNELDAKSISKRLDEVLATIPGIGKFNTHHNRRLEYEKEYGKIIRGIGRGDAARRRPTIQEWANSNVYEPLEREVVRRYPEAFGRRYQLKSFTGGNRGRTTGTGRIRQEDKEGERLSSRSLGDGRSFTEFFSEVTRGESGLPIPGKIYKPAIPIVSEELRNKNSDISKFAAKHTKHRGKFDSHIEKSIPGFYEVQLKVGNALSQMYSSKQSMLDIGASEGALVKAITQTSGMKTVALDPNPDMKDQFDKTRVLGSRFAMEAFGTAEQEGQFAWDEKGTPINYFDSRGKKFNVVHEAMVFQFMSPNREQHIKRAKELLKDGGLFIVEEKVLNADKEQFLNNEKAKNTFKSQYFRPEDINKKHAEVIEGMEANMVEVGELENMLKRNFKSVQQFWDSGNFKGYVASDNPVAVYNFHIRVGKTKSPYSTTDNAFYQLKPTFFSAVGKAAENFPSTMNALSVKNWLRKQPNVKQEELDWLDIESFLKGKKSVSKEELQDWIDAHEIQVEERQLLSGGRGYNVVDTTTGEIYGTHDNLRDAKIESRLFSEQNGVESEVQDATAATKFGDDDLVLPGGRKYSELLLKLPNPSLNWMRDFLDGGYDVLDADRNVVETFATRKEAKEYISEHTAGNPDLYSSSHFQDANILAHIRFNSRVDSDGNNVLFIEEIQSDWHQEAAGLREDMIRTEVEFGLSMSEAKKKFPKDWAYGLESIPDAPFKGDGWLHLSLKRMIRYAAENGYDKIAWTTGAQQVERYETATRARVDQIHWQTSDKAFVAEQNGKYYAVLRGSLFPAEDRQSAEDIVNRNRNIVINGIKDDRSVGTFTVPVNGSTRLNGKDVTLEGLLGKNIASQIRESDKRSGTIEGGDLTIGGEGMKLWYDRKIPSFLKKYGKKWGVEVGESKFHKDEVGVDARSFSTQSIEITPQMEASVLEGQPLFQLKKIELTEEDTKNLLIRKIIDKMRPLQMLQKDIEDKHGKLSDAEDALLHTELFIGRGDQQIKDFQKRTIDVDNKDSFLSRLSEAEIELEDLGRYLHALHAAERNVKTGRKKGSGMSDKEASSIIEELEKNKGIKKFAREAQKIADEALKIRLKAGLIDKDTYNRLKSTYKNYVPLFRVMDVEEPMFSTGKGFSVTGADVKKAVGSEREVINPFVNLIAQYEEAVIRAEKNKVGQALLKLLTKHKSDAWSVGSRTYVPKYNKEGELEFLSPRINEEIKGDAVVVKVKGKVKVIKFKGEQGAKVANAIKGVGVMRAVPLINNINSFLRLASTTYNPEFLVTNLSRDLQTAGIHIGGEFGKQELLSALNPKNIASAIRGIYRETKGKEDTEWAKWYKELKEQGGRMGWFEQDSLQDKLKKLEKNLARVDKTGKGVKLAGHAIARTVNNMNESVESAVRLTLYKTLVQRGVTKKRAAQAAKNITVNFNRKGEMGSFINSIYLFSNATIQGGYRIAFSLAKSKRTRQIASSIVALGFLEAFFNMMMNDDEYEKMNSWTKDNNWVFMMPSGDYLKIRVPYGYNIFKTMGNLAAESIREHQEVGRINYGDKMSRMLGAVDAAYNPFSGPTFGQTLSPTALDWAVQIGENKDYKGAPIMPDNYFPPYKADVERKFSTARTRSVEFAEGLFEATGGDIYRDNEGTATEAIRGPLTIDISPETIDHMINFIGGGAGKTVSNAINTVTNLVEGKDFQSQNAPFLRLFYGEPNEYSEMRLVNKYRKEMSRYRFTAVETEKYRQYLKDALAKGVIDGKKYNKYWREFDKAQRKLRANPSTAKQYTITIDGVDY